MEHHDNFVEEIYNNFIKANSILYSININEIFELLLNYRIENFSTTYPIINPYNLNKNDIMMGVDNNYYIVKYSTNGDKYWKKINRK